MKVKEWIEQLSKLDQESEISLYDGAWQDWDEPKTVEKPDTREYFIVPSSQV